MKGVESFKGGKADLLMGMIYNADRGDLDKCAIVHSFVNLAIVARKSDNINKISDLNRSTILVQKESNTENILKNNNVNANVVYVNSLRDGLNMIINHEADYMLCPEEVARAIIPLRGQGKLNIVNIGFSPREYRFVSNDKELIAKINKAFYNLKSDGT